MSCELPTPEAVTQFTMNNEDAAAFLQPQFNARAQEIRAQQSPPIGYENFQPEAFARVLIGAQREHWTNVLIVTAQAEGHEASYTRSSADAEDLITNGTNRGSVEFFIAEGPPEGWNRAYKRAKEQSIPAVHVSSLPNERDRATQLGMETIPFDQPPDLSMLREMFKQLNK